MSDINADSGATDAHIGAAAMELAQRPSSDARKARALAHAQRCPACAEALLAADEALAHAASLTPGVVLAAMEQEARVRAGGRLLAGALVLAGGLALALFGQRHGDGALTWSLFFAVTLASALLLALDATTRAARFLPIVALLSCALTALAGPSWAEGRLLGLECGLSELALALVPSALFALIAWRNADPIDARRLARAALFGGLAGQSALLVVCPLGRDLLHLLVFHNLGLVLIGAVSFGLGRAIRRRQTRAGRALG